MGRAEAGQLEARPLHAHHLRGRMNGRTVHCLEHPGLETPPAWAARLPADARRLLRRTGRPRAAQRCYPHRHCRGQAGGERKHSTAQHSTAQHSTAQHSTAQHSTASKRPTWNTRKPPGVGTLRCLSSVAFPWSSHSSACARWVAPAAAAAAAAVRPGAEGPPRCPAPLAPTTHGPPVLSHPTPHLRVGCTRVGCGLDQRAWVPLDRHHALAARRRVLAQRHHCVAVTACGARRRGVSGTHRRLRPLAPRAAAPARARAPSPAGAPAAPLPAPRAPPCVQQHLRRSGPRWPPASPAGRRPAPPPGASCASWRPWPAAGW